MEEIIASAITGNIGAMVLLVILWRIGFFKKNINGNGLEKKIDAISDNHLHEIIELLKDSREEQRSHGYKLDKVVDNTIFIKAKLTNGK